MIAQRRSGERKRSAVAVAVDEAVKREGDPSLAHLRSLTHSPPSAHILVLVLATLSLSRFSVAPLPVPRPPSPVAALPFVPFPFVSFAFPKNLLEPAR